MEIKVRVVSHYRDVELKVDDTVITFGLLNSEERLALAKELKRGIYDLLDLETYEKLMADEP